jgi:transposase
MEAMTKHRSHSVAFKRQVAEEFIAGETLHDISRQDHDLQPKRRRRYVVTTDSNHAGALIDQVEDLPEDQAGFW